ncbi:MAG: neutral/alkaline non-lysosomal ceramidase N-terminal domain-containing protein [Bryobacteraceae bacterium]
MKAIRISLSGGWTAAFALAPLLAGADYQAGVASLIITPKEPIYLSGYASRKHASEGVLLDLKAKALVVQDKHGQKTAIVTTDLIGLPRSISEPVAARVQKSYGIDRAHLLLNSSHTHTGPLLANNLSLLFELDEHDQDVVNRYSQQLTDDLVNLVGAALQDMAPANLWFGHGAAHFGVNRREPAAKGIVIGVNSAGPTDPDVPVLKVTGADGKLRAVLFGYACHNTTLTGEHYKLSGDYAGFAQRDFEKSHPGATAMFMMLCGADQNPNPRSTVELAEQHGATLAAEIARVVDTSMQPVHGNVRAAFQVTDLDFAHHSRDTYESRLQDKNVFRVRHAKAMLRSYDEGHPVRHYPYPVQAISFGKSVTVLALGGEVVVDYVLRAKKEYGAKNLMVAGYSNDVMSYIPSLRVLKEGGYEADESMIYYGQPGPYAEDVEDRVFGAIHKVMARAGRKPGAAN